MGPMVGAGVRFSCGWGAGCWMRPSWARPGSIVFVRVFIGGRLMGIGVFLALQSTHEPVWPVLQLSECALRGWGWRRA